MQRAKRIINNTFDSLRVRNFRIYFYGQIISLSGNWMQAVAQGLLVLKLTGSGTILGVVTALQFLPMLLIGPWGGVMADRFPKIKVLYITQILFGILTGLMGILVITNTIELWMVYTLSLAIGLVNAVDNPTRQTFVVEMVGREKLQNAVALQSSVVNLARVIGPAIAGVLIVTVGLGVCFLVNAVSFVAMMISLYFMNPSELDPAPLVAKQKGQIKEGFVYVLHTPLLRDILVMMAVMGTFSYEFMVILPLFSEDTFNGNEGTYALITSAMGIGAVIGGLLSANKKSATPTYLIIIAFLFGISMLVASVMPTLALAAIAMVFVGFFSLIFNSVGNSLLQIESAPNMRGRVMALWAIAFMGTTPIGGPIIGWIGEHISARAGLGVGGVAAILACVYGFFMLHLPKKAVSTIQAVMK